jgi:hypothetical protein
MTPAPPEEIVSLVAALRRVKGRLDVVHYTTAINHAGKTAGAKTPFPSAASSSSASVSGVDVGGGVTAGVAAGGTVAAREGAVRARTLLGWMEEDGVRPNDVTYTSLIHILGQVCICVCV